MRHQCTIRLTSARGAAEIPLPFLEIKRNKEAKQMTKAEELENVILGQIELLGDDSVFDDGEKLDRLIRRSDAMSELSENWIKIQQMKADEKRLRIEAVRVMYSVACGDRNEDNSVKEFLGIGSKGSAE